MVRIRSYRRSYPEYHYQKSQPNWDDLVHETIEKTTTEVLSDIRGRCTVPPWAFDDCIKYQERLIDELRLWLLNDQDLYYNGPFSFEYRRSLNHILESFDQYIEDGFHVEAEQEIREMSEVRISETDPQKRAEQLGKEIADRLWLPVIEEYAEIPKEQRKAAADNTKIAMRRLIADYTTALTANWPRRER